jgi:hypothetical protein
VKFCFCLQRAKNPKNSSEEKSGRVSDGRGGVCVRLVSWVVVVAAAAVVVTEQVRFTA